MSDNRTATTGPEGDKNVAQLDLTSSTFKLGVYRHYKGGHYIAFATSLKEDTLEPLVHYYSIEKKTRWTRTLSNFTERLGGELDKYIVHEHMRRPHQRFEYLYPASWYQLAEAAGFFELLQGLRALLRGQRFLRTLVDDGK